MIAPYYAFDIPVPIITRRCIMTRRDLLFSKYYKMCWGFCFGFFFFAALWLAANVLLRLINGEAMLIWFD